MKLRLVFCCGLAFAGCLQTTPFFSDDPTLELPPAQTSEAHLEALQYNPKWYRTYDTNTSILPEDGGLLYNWSYGDPARHADSFYVGIDTLWGMPRAMGGDTSANGDWDLQVCPDGFCMLGLRANIHGANAPRHFGGTGPDANTTFQTEHHFEFFPAHNPNTYQYIAPANTILGAMMFVRSLSTGKADTVFGFAAWELEWDSLYLPPVHPVNGYLPKKSDFTIVNGKARYAPSGSPL